MVMDELEEYVKCYKNQQALIELGNLLWDNNWSWTVTKQEVDFAVEKLGQFEVGVATFVNITILSNRIERQNVGYCHISNANRGTAYSLSRKISVLNALKEAMCSFGGEISDKVEVALQTGNNKVIIPLNDPSSKLENRDVRNESRSGQTKPSEITPKPKSPGKTNRFPSKTFNENSPSVQNNVIGNFSTTKQSNIVHAPSAVDRSTSAQINQNVRLPNSNNPQFAPKAPSTVLTAFNPKSSLAHSKAPLQQIQSNVITPITQDSTKPTEKKVMTTEEIRLERLRKQREQQELFRKQMEFKHVQIENNSEISTQDMIIAAENAMKYGLEDKKEPNKKRHNANEDINPPKKR